MKFDTLYLELIDSTNMIRALLAGITQEEACTKPDAESWSILELLCHLYDEEREDFREHLDFILYHQHEVRNRRGINGPTGARAENCRDLRDDA